jgi:hypothetical protein
VRRKATSIIAAAGAILLMCAGLASAASPTITVLAPTGITAGSATIHATIAPGGAPTYYEVDWGLTTAYTNQTRLIKLSSTTTPRTISVNLTGLQPGSIYHYRISSLNKFGAGLSADHAFKTAGHPPADVATGGADVLSDSSATVTAIINPHGQTTRYYFQYAPAGSAALVNTQTQTLSSTSTSQVVATTLAGLAPGSFFGFRVVAVHSGAGGNATTTGAFVTFLTFPDPAHKRAPGVSSATNPHRALKRPFVLTTNGHLSLPPGIPASYGCPQLAQLTVMDGTHRVANEIFAIGADCHFSTTTLISRLPRVKHKRGAKHRPVRVSVYVKFGGNNYVLPSRARPVHVQLGR